MKLSDWPIVMYGNELCCGAGPGSPLGDCYKELMSAIDGGPDIFAELAGAIVNHARRKHGTEIERDGVWYRSITPDGKLWAESSNVDDFKSGIYHNEQEREERMLDPLQLTYECVSVYTVVFAEEWKP
jgi:hypothetical protein